MRITGGIHGGRRLKVPRGGVVRPTLDQVREALFSMVAAALPQWRVLDLFAGSGAVGFDAISRGAVEVVWVEREKRTCTLIEENCRTLQAENGRVVCADVFRWITGPGKNMGFDMVFADPPYEFFREADYSGIMGSLCEYEVIAPGGWFVGEQPAKTRAVVVPGWELLRDRTYGAARLVIYRR
ncbi:MAG: 16S rRNA (guanine(966)-N(2))-methyltransferase RsmD [Lentisphaerae bacterium]|jgi:16S rRNA (guanine966-N2)-methyltransferase|nr:16S rRNA (guanine(966)-N(2))-methyltransferase RsmD [Lentisphaerota bacterium]